MIYTALTSWFAHPLALGLFALLPLLATLLLWARRRRQRALAQLASALALPRLLQLRPGARCWQTILLFAGLVLLILGLAGPQWGREPLPPQSGRGELAVVLDVSRSMFAEQPSRLERSVRALRHFADTLDERGGPRVALVIFAAQPQLVFPLTNDYGHFRFALQPIRDGDLPPALRPNAEAGDVSGTRIGAALKQAIAALEPARQGQAIVLVSDGDDPAGDEEWLEGVQAARARQVPVHVVAVGDPAEEHAIFIKGERLHYQGKPVGSRVNEKLLQEIARRTDGVYLPAPGGQLPVGRLLLDILAAASEEGSATQLQVSQPRYAWFLFPAVLLLAVGVAWPEHPRAGIRRWPKVRQMAAALAALLLVSATLPEVQEWLRQGNAAFERGEFEEALTWYDKAAAHTDDPGLVAFNQAAAYYRLERFREAELHYQRALEDDAMPRERRLRAWFDLGNSLVKQAGESQPALLERAMAAYRACLADAEPSTELARDARHNLELASALWVKARAKAPEQPDGPDPKNEPRPKNGKKEPGGKDSNTTGDNGEDLKNGEKNGNGTRPGQAKKVAPGPLRVLPDEGKLVPLSPLETEAYLERLAERIRNERRTAWGQRVPPVGKVKDW